MYDLLKEFRRIEKDKEDYIAEGLKVIRPLRKTPSELHGNWLGNGGYPRLVALYRDALCFLYDAITKPNDTREQKKILSQVKTILEETE